MFQSRTNNPKFKQFKVCVMRNQRAIDLDSLILAIYSTRLMFCGRYWNA